MVLCICLNPAIDKYVREDNSTITTSYGGKAINTAVTLSVLGIQSSVIGFVGENEYDFYDNMLSSRGIINHLIPTNAHTRTNIKIVKNNGSIIEKNERGFTPDKNSQILLLDKIKQLSSSHDIALISGSIPPELDTNYLEQIIDILDIEFVLDTYPDDVATLLNKGPLLIKPNRYELDKLARNKLENLDDVISYSEKLLEFGAKNVLISLDKSGAIFINNQTRLFAKAPSLVTKSTVGAGDSMIAGYIYSHLNKSDHIETLVNCISAGSAHTLTIGTMPMVKNDFLKLIQEVEVTSI